MAAVRQAAELSICNRLAAMTRGHAYVCTTPYRDTAREPISSTPMASTSAARGWDWHWLSGARSGRVSLKTGAHRRVVLDLLRIVPRHLGHDREEMHSPILMRSEGQNTGYLDDRIPPCRVDVAEHPLGPLASNPVLMRG